MDWLFMVSPRTRIRRGLGSKILRILALDPRARNLLGSPTTEILVAWLHSSEILGGVGISRLLTS